MKAKLLIGIVSTVLLLYGHTAVAGKKGLRKQVKQLRAEVIELNQAIEQMNAEFMAYLQLNNNLQDMQGESIDEAYHLALSVGESQSNLWDQFEVVQHNANDKVHQYWFRMSPGHVVEDVLLCNKGGVLRHYGTQADDDYVHVSTLTPQHYQAPGYTGRGWNGDPNHANAVRIEAVNQGTGYPMLFVNLYCEYLESQENDDGNT